MQIALYFSWLGHYTTALSIPAVVGFLFWFFFYGHTDILEDIGFVIFAFFNVIWATLYLESWKRRSAELAHTWGTADQRDELLAEPRPQFKASSFSVNVSQYSEIFGNYLIISMSEWFLTKLYPKINLEKMKILALSRFYPNS